MPVRVNGSTRVVAVFGDPIAHTASPAMHNAAFAALGMNWVYIACRVPMDRLESALRGVAAMGMPGVNLTVPLKEEGLRIVDRLDPLAAVLGAVNTVVVGEDERLEGSNTDGPGLVEALREAFGFEFGGARVAVVGAGGSGRAVVAQAAMSGAARVGVWNRSPDRADAAVAAVREHGADGTLSGACELSAMPWSSLTTPGALDDFDIIVNATSLGLREGDPSPVPRTALRPGILVYDLVYRPAPTPLERVAAQAGARVANGLGMLLHQGALSFRMWTGREPPLDVMRAALERTRAE